MISPGRRSGVFITFEGVDGSGKSLQASLLARSLRTNGVKVLETHEPGGTSCANLARSPFKTRRLARRVLKTGRLGIFGPSSEALVLSAARYDHLTHVIRPALSMGMCVICDRFIDSTRAYQGAGKGVNENILSQLEGLVVGETRPDITFILDIPYELSILRLKKRRLSHQNPAEYDAFETQPMNFHNAVRQSFLDIARIEPNRCIVLDGHDSPEQIAQRVLEKTVSVLSG